MSKKLTNTVLHIKGMTCANCAAGIQKHLNSKGLHRSNVSFANAEASIYHSGNWDVNSLIKEIESIGFKASSEAVQKNDDLVEKLFGICLLFTIPLFAHMFLAHDHFLQNPLLQIFLCLPVYIIGIMYFGKSAINSLKVGMPNMDVLIIMGTTAAFVYSLTGTLMYWGTLELHKFLFFETTATIITLVFLGNLLEHRSVKQTTSAIQELTAMQELMATRETIKGETEQIPFKQIQKEDILIVNSGDKIPTDGIITEGVGILDESMLTGENEPVHRAQKDRVIGGTILADGNLKVKATLVGKETVLSQIIEMVKKAQNNKPNIQQLGDKVSALFVPIVLAISLFTFFVSHYAFNISTADAVMRAVAVLVISCPCAMGLATPTAVMVGLGRAAKSGILIKGGSTLETFAQVKHIFFDKTGTLTSGNFKIEKINCETENLKEIKELLYSLEQHSSHPIAKSIVKELEGKTNKIHLNDIQEHKGKGIEGKWNNNYYYLGSYNIAQELTKDSSHSLYLLKNNQLFATIDIEDEVKPTTQECLQSLKLANLNPIMLSGDKKEKCIALANELDIKTVYFEQLPHQKLQRIIDCKKQGNTAMVGDGINDAPALAQADIGISLSNGTQIAIQSAQIVLLNGNDLSKIFEALKISKHTLLTIKQNLFWAFSYNIVAIPIAAMGLLNPMWGAFFMAFSDIVVIGNSLRLKKKSLN
ncbi:MAG: ATPase P [Flavobacteriales bacterium]|nr:ATPase P [Flavobacteriales bacterium]|tara:strand:- start:11708 stop:13819 length:2112 start_codon:yes stop_codon:yes gene_type:complete